MTLNKPNLLVFGLASYAVLSLISMATMSVGAVILVVCLVISRGGPLKLHEEIHSRIRKNPTVRRFGFISFGFAVACLLSLVAGKIWPLSVDGKFSEVHLRDIAKLWYFAWPFILWFALSLCQPSQRKLVFKTWIGTFLALAIVGLIQHFTGWPRPQGIPDYPGHFHVTLFLGHHLSVASILIFPYFALIDSSALPKWLRWVGGLLGFAVLMLTFSRTLWIALPVGLLVWALLQLKKRRRVIALVLLALGGAVIYQMPMVHERLNNSMGIQERKDLWEANWQFFKERPLTGVGLKHNEALSGFYLMQKYHSTSVFQGHAHNNVLDILGSTGIAGATGFAIWWTFLFWILWLELKNREEKKRGDVFFGQGLMAAFVVFQINGLTQVNFWEAKVQHQLMWMVAWILLWS